MNQVIDANGNPTGETVQDSNISHYISQTVTGQKIVRGLGDAKDIYATWLASDVRRKDGRIVRFRVVAKKEARE